MKINGHEMASLVVPASRSDSPLITRAVGRFLALPVDADTEDGACWQVKAHGSAETVADGISTDILGGNRLRRGYTGQSFILRVPVWALSEKGKQAAAEFAGGGK